MAGMRTVEELLKLDPTRYDITVFGTEPDVNYDRTMIASVLTGQRSEDDLILNSRAWYDAHNIVLHSGDPVLSIDPALRTVTSVSGVKASYDRLLLATGSRPLIPSIPGLYLDGVCAFRDLLDVDTMITAAATHQHAVVIGGGVLGLEAAWGLKQLGMDVAVVHLTPTLMERQLDEAAGLLLQNDLARRGIAFFTNSEAEELLGDDFDRTSRVAGVRLADGRKIPADLVVLAIGTRPEIDLALAAGLDVNRGIVVHDNLATSDPDIFAVGECAEHRGLCVGMVAPIWDMARVCAHHLAGGGTMAYAPQAIETRLKIRGVDVYSAGVVNASEHEEEILLRDAGTNAYRKLVMRDGRVVGAVLYGDVRDSEWYFDLIRSRVDVSDFAGSIIHGRAAAERNGASGLLDVSSMPDDMQVCACNGVRKGDIATMIQARCLSSLDEVKHHTTASACCGLCAPVVKDILIETLGMKWLCQTIPKCTSCGHEDVHDAARNRVIEGVCHPCCR